VELGRTRRAALVAAMAAAVVALRWLWVALASVPTVALLAVAVVQRRRAQAWRARAMRLSGLYGAATDTRWPYDRIGVN
jgi:hypothetical protein